MRRVVTSRRPDGPRLRSRRINGWGRDLRHAARLWRKRPGFTALAVATIALGIGATTAIVSVVDRVLLRPLPYPNPHELVTVWNTFDTWRGHDVLDAFWQEMPLSYPEYVDWRDGQRAFQAVAIYAMGRSTITGLGDPDEIAFGTASASLFPMLGVRPVVGRTFDPDEEGGGGARVTMVSYEVWVTRLGRADDAIGRTITIDGERYQVIGVLPPAFRLRSLRSDILHTEVWVPAGTLGDAHDRGRHHYEAIARLRPGVTREQAAADARPFLHGDGSPEHTGGVRVLSRHDEEVASSRGPLLLLLATAGLLMLIACVNVATLFTAEATSRRHELAVRGALGASRGRLIIQLVLESSSIGVLGAVVGMALALVSVRFLLMLAPPDLILPDRIPIDLRILLFTAGLGVSVGLAFGVGPALAVTRRGHSPVLYRRTTAGHRATSRMQRLMVAVESALSMVLLVVALQLDRSLFATQAVDPGFRGKNLIGVSVPLTGPRTQEARVIQLARDLVEEVAAIPGVTTVTGANSVPFSGQGGRGVFSIVGRSGPENATLPAAHRRTVLPRFHEVLGIPVLAGREISNADVETGRRVVVVSEALARQYWPGASPLGEFILRDDQRWEIVGVVGDVLHTDLTAERQATLYFSFFQQPPPRFWLIVRSNVAPGDLTTAVRQTMVRVAPEVAVGRVERLDDLVQQSAAGARYRTMLVTVFGGCALLLAGVRMFGVTARTVVSRRRELGIRLALGAGRRQVMRAVMTKEARAMASGVVVGVVLAAIAVQGIAPFLFGVSPYDPLTFVGAGIGLTVVGLIASWLPARRTVSVDPAEVLQVE